MAGVIKREQSGLVSLRVRVSVEAVSLLLLLGVHALLQRVSGCY